MRPRTLCAALSSAVLLAVLVNPGAAHAAPLPAQADGSAVRCAEPPPTEGTTAENRDRFVELWSPRFTDNAWRKDFVALEEVPADILAEGFHALPEPTQLWLSSCLLEDLLAVTHTTPTAQERETYLAGVAMVIFGKEGTEQLKEDMNEPAETPPASDLPPVNRDQTGEALDDVAEELAEAPSLTSAQLPRTSKAAPSARTSSAVTAGLPPSFNDTLTSLPLVPLVLDALDELLQEVGKVQGKLFTLPVVNLLSPLFYKICAESPTMTLSCSISLPVGVPVPADVTGDHLPDVLGQLNPVTNLIDVGARFAVQRIAPNSGPLPAHVFAVYDTPIVKKRVTVGIDGRASTLGGNSTARVMLKNIVDAITGDIKIAADVTSTNPGPTEAITFGVKSLTGGSGGVPLTEQDPLTGSVQLSPFPTTLDVGAQMTHRSTGSKDTITVNTPTATRVDAVIDQATTSGPVDSDRRFTATVDKLPSSVRVDLTRQGTHQNIEYTANDEIALVEATDTTTPDITRPTEVDHAVYRVNGIPKHMSVDLDGDLITYDASDSIDKVYAGVERMGGDRITAEVLGIPAHAEVLFDGKGSVLDWDADTATTSAAATAHLTAATLGTDRDFDAGLAITSIPAKWNASWADGDVLFEAPAGGIGSIVANVTNHETFSTLSGDHLAAYYDEASGNLDASLKISNLRRAAFSKLPDDGDGGGFEAGLDMGDNSIFAFAAETHLAQGDVVASGQLSNLPSQVTLRSEGGRITYEGNTNPDLTLSVAAGKAAALAATPVPPQVHGVAVRDGASGSDKAVRAKLYLTGLPTGLDLDSTHGTYTVTGFHPTNGTLVVDAKLQALAPKPLSLYLTQGIPTANPVDFTFGPIVTRTEPDGQHTIGIDYVASETLGAFTANAQYDNTDEAQLTISAIPKTISVDASFGADTKEVDVAMDQGISDITAAYKHVGDLDFAASVHLHDVPKTVDLLIGKKTQAGSGTTVDAPVFTMTAFSPGLDIDAFASARIADPVDAAAAVTLDVTDLGQLVTADLIGARLHITSAPATHAFALEAAGRVQKSISLDWGSGEDGQTGFFQNRGNLSADLKIHRVTLGLTDFSDVNLRLGFTTGLDGDFGTFTFGQDTDLTVDLEERFSVFIDWPDPLGTDTITIVDIPHASIPFGNVAPRWHINQNVQERALHLPIIHFGIADCGVSFDVRPAPGYTTPGNTFTLGQPAGDGTHTPAWLITPDINLLGLSLPDFGLDIIAYFLSPYGNNIKVYPECQWLV
ncbi:hypothetical protein QI633_14115 [Nocardioides sp. QY071]|uniref:hypothetical protein n=1 Tax=Nocardioides sp. QY071 TaxID=3044187 RepID=UPI002499E453|nr:hypothetical protein [Nocardioides sp. QY071]WGX99675.1 hypothetical protein QI633_14115 [Nocardioides sp. QY071]